MRYKVLIADDEKTALNGLVNYLPWDELDCAVTAAVEDGQAAIRAIQGNPPDIVVTDINMPELDGIELAAYIHQHHPRIKVIILTGHARFEYARAALQSGVAEYILKPVVKQELIEAVQKACRELAEGGDRLRHSQPELWESRPDQTSFTGCRQDDMKVFAEIEQELAEWHFPAVQIAVSQLFARLSRQPHAHAEARYIAVQIYYICLRALLKNNLNYDRSGFFGELRSCPDTAGISTLMGEYCEAAERLLKGNGRIGNEIVNRAIQYIHEHYQEELPLAVIAGALHVNSSHLSRIFKRECNGTISDYIVKIRIEKAQELLTFSDVRTAEAARAVGFRDASYFATVFKRITGMTPTEYKKFRN